MNTNTSASGTLLFIPDISGFTKFVNETEIDHAKHIIEELLELIIDSNEIGLKLSEIEGDALLFYRPGKAPTSAELLAQIQKMYVNFHGHLKKYDTHRICSCGACCSATNLQLKFVAHYGEVANKTVKDRSKLFGKDVIVAHRLLKNEVNSDEYGLFSENLLRACSSWVNLEDISWSEVTHMQEDYDFGKANYCFIGLEPLEEHVPEPRIEDYRIQGKTVEVIEMGSLIEAPLDLVFDVISDLSFRHVWMTQLLNVQDVNHALAQQGSSHKCVVQANGNGPVIISHDFQMASNRVTFVDSNHKNQVDTIWELKQIGKGLTRVSVTNYAKPFSMMRLMTILFKKKIAKDMDDSYQQLNEYCKELVANQTNHSNRIIMDAALEPA